MRNISVEGIGIKILILGASGVVGFHLAERLEKEHEVIRASRSSRSSDIHVDLSSKAGIAQALECKPDVVVNAVKPALSVDEMETNWQETYSLNAILPERLAHEQKRRGFKLMQISSDGVYPGRKGEIYDEGSQTYPPNYYCYTKALADERIACIADNYLILRTEGIFGYDEKGTNFFMRMASADKIGKPFYAASDQFSQPMCALELARLAEALISRKRTGVYNACGADFISRYMLATLIKREMGWKLELKKSSIKERKITVQSHLRVDISKIERDAGKVAALSPQISELRRWMDENQHV